MLFKVPQFIDIEDKIFGPFTFKQFIYLTGGAGLCFITWKLLPLLIALLLIPIIAGLALALTFYKVNNRPFVQVMQSYFVYLFQSKLYIWKQGHKEQSKSEKVEEKKDQQAPKLSGSRLKDLSWSLDVLDLNKNK